MKRLQCKRFINISPNQSFVLAFTQSSVSMNNTAETLRQQQHPLIRDLAKIIEETWTEYLPLSAYEFPGDLGFIEGRLEGEALQIQNVCYQTPQFRKLHLELAKVGNNLDILHCVMFPNSDYPLPMFGTDIVCGRGTISAAIVDLSPTSLDYSLPERYVSRLEALPTLPFDDQRALPNWGDIFSNYCLFVRPSSSSEAKQFLERVTDYLKLHCEIALTTSPITSPEEQQQIRSGQVRYCTQQQKNDKTRRVLEKAFGPEWTERYMTTMLFDCIVDAA
jgi:phycocyanobilin:ferredoxin oxidoreductase